MYAARCGYVGCVKARVYIMVKKVFRRTDGIALQTSILMFSLYQMSCDVYAQCFSCKPVKTVRLIKSTHAHFLIGKQTK